MSLTSDEVDVCNQALDRLGALTFTYANQATDTNGIRCERIYAQTRNALLRSFAWNFALTRAVLQPNTTDPDFEWDYRFKLPADFIRFKEDYSIDDSADLDDRFEINGEFLLTNDDEVEIKYVQKVTDPTKFDPLFTELLILSLAKKLIPKVVGSKNPILVQEIKDDLQTVRRSAIAACRQEADVSGRRGWNYAHNTFDTSP